MLVMSKNLKPLEKSRDELIEEVRKIRTIANSYYIADIIGYIDTLNEEIAQTQKVITLAMRHLQNLITLKDKEVEEK